MSRHRRLAGDRTNVRYLGALSLIAIVALGYWQWETVAVGVARVAAPTWNVPAVDLAGMTPNVSDAITASRMAVNKDPTSHAVWYEYAAVLHAHSLHSPAIEAYERAAALRPDDPRTYYLRAMLLPGEGGSADQSLAFYERTAEMDPHYPPVWLRMGQLLSSEGRQQEAHGALQRAVELDPVYPLAHREFGLLLLEMGDTPNAILHLKFAASLEEDDYPTWAGLSRAYRQAGLNEDAAAAAERSIPLIEVTSHRDSVLEDVLNRGVGPVRLERLADAYLRAGAWSLAIETLKRVERDLPSSAAIQRKLGEAYAAAGEVELAGVHQRRAADLGDG